MRNFLVQSVHIKQIKGIPNEKYGKATNSSKINWRDLQGLSWNLEECYNHDQCKL